ncbi:hypothetical protein MPLB_1490012 [Mesorhizobium sp. ORS 3324]|nr:hypothetical protein MPLB_1490012 [Mesorhizobium sp. ORS 3324]
MLDLIYTRLREIGRSRTKLHTDDTRLPILALSTGMTHKEALCVYLADDRNSGSQEPRRYPRSRLADSRGCIKPDIG